MGTGGKSFKIAMLVDFFSGGKQTYVQVLSKGLRERGHHVSIYTLDKISKAEEDDVFKVGSFYQRIPSREGRPQPPLRDWLLTASLRTALERQRPDVMHVHDYATLYAALPLKARIGIPLVVTLHDYFLACPNTTLVRGDKTCEMPLTRRCIGCGDDHELPLAKSLLAYLGLRMNKSKLSCVDKIISTHDFQKEMYLRTFDLRDEAISVIPNPIDLNHFKPDKVDDDARRSYEMAIGERWDGMNAITYVSRLFWDKMDAITSVINSVPSVAREFPNIKVLIIGGGECLSYVNELAQKVNRELPKRAIVVMGTVHNKYLPSIFNLSAAVIGIGRVALEAMACGKPVIVGGGTFGPLGGNYGGIAMPDNVLELEAHNFSGRNSAVRICPDKVAEDSVKLLTDENLRHSLGAFGREYTEREHDVMAIAKQIESIYCEAIEARRQEQMAISVV